MTTLGEIERPFRAYLKAWRNDHELTQVQAADLVGQRPGTWQDWEEGKHHPHAGTEAEVRRRMEKYTNSFFDEGNKIDIESIDELRDTFITIGCYRETHRLARVLRVFEKALTLARAEKKDGHLIYALKSLHDRKGLLTAKWAGEQQALAFHSFIDRAWQDECEGYVEHKAECIVAGTDVTEKEGAA